MFLQSYKEAVPNTARKHNFADAVFLPDMMTGFNIDGEDTDKLTIQKDDGSVKITLSDVAIKMKAPMIDLEGTDINFNSTNATFNNTNTIFNSTYVTNNSKNIGDTHIHPQGPDSDGDSQQNTGAPQ